MVAALNMTDYDQSLGSPPSPPANAMEAQKAAIVAQQQAEAAQQEALKMQAEESGADVPPTSEERLKAASEAVRKADENLINHALK